MFQILNPVLLPNYVRGVSYTEEI